MTTLTDIRQAEREALCATLRKVGPEAPTLCNGWSAEHIAAHLVVSERGWGLPIVAAYQLRRVLPASVVLRGLQSLRPVGDRQIDHGRDKGWGWLLQRLAGGSPRPYRLASVAPIRLIEEWIHHEDIRRANDPEPRDQTVEINEALWQAGLSLTRFREFLPGRTAVQIALPDGRHHSLGASPTVRVQGLPGELLLFLAGRVDVARVNVDGEGDDIRELHSHLAV